MINIKPPSRGTLRKYGISEPEWYAMLHEQGGCCPICERRFTETMRPCVDHLHAKGFKKMADEDKKRYVRGLLCFFCNKQLIPKGMTTMRAWNVYDYLLAFDGRYNA